MQFHRLSFASPRIPYNLPLDVPLALQVFQSVVTWKMNTMGTTGLLGGGDELASTQEGGVGLSADQFDL